MGQLADDGCDIQLNKNTIVITKNNRKILTGTRNNTDGLWDIPLKPISQGDNIENSRTRQQTCTNHLHMIVHKKQSVKTLVHYLYACMFCPPKSTFLKAIANGNLITFPGLTLKVATKYLEELPATALGHLDQERKNIQSTTNTSQAAAHI